MLDLRSLEKISRWLTTGMYLALLIQQFRWLNFSQVPVFCCYLALRATYLIWSPHTTVEKLFIEPWLACLRFLSIIEAVRLCFSRLSASHATFRWAILTMLSVAMAGAAVLHGYLFGPTAEQIYRGIRQHFYTGLALACLVGAAIGAGEGLRLRLRVEKHYLILTAYFVTISIFGFFNPHDPDTYYELRTLFLLTSSICLMLWLRLGTLNESPAKSRGGLACQSEAGTDSSPLLPPPGC
jgi:hypothetical protein